MLLLLTIYGLTVSSTGLLILAAFPELQAKLKSYVSRQTQHSGKELSEMFIDIPREQLALFYAALPFVAGLGLWLILGRIWWLPVGVLAGFVLPRWIMRLIKADRENKFRAQLVDALMVLSSAMKAGLSLLQALEVVVEESPVPMSQEIGLVVKEMRMGMSMEEALRRLKERMPMDELSLIVTTILVARETGGDVTAVFAKLVETIRERFKIKERIKTLTVIPRTQGWIMALMPFVFYHATVKSSPDYFKVLFTDPVGNMFGIGAIALWASSLVLIAYFSRPPK